MKGHIHTLVPKDVLEYVLQGAPNLYSRVQPCRLGPQPGQPHALVHESPRERKPVLRRATRVDSSMWTLYPAALTVQHFRDDLGQALAEAFPTLAPSIQGELARSGPAPATARNEPPAGQQQ